MERVRNARSSPPKYTIEKKERVLNRDEHIYANNLDDLMEMFRATQRLLDEMGFQEIHETFSEHWETLPFKTGVEAKMWKDPYTAIVLEFKLRVKEPRSDRKTAEDVYKAKVTMKSEVHRTRYPNWQWFGEASYFRRSKLYHFIHKIAELSIFPSQMERYKEEAEEIGLEFISQIREIEGSLPAIGKSKREFYNPNRPGRK
jgi:hypothetical protein